MFDSQTLAEHQAFLRRIARDVVPDEHLAEDLVQETLVHALHASPEGLRSPRAWMRTVLRNLASTFGTREARRAARESLVARAEAVEATEGALELRGLVRSAVERLPEADRAVLEPYYFHDVGVDELAARSEATVDAVKSRLKRARQRVRADLERRHGRETLTAALLPFLVSERSRAIAKPAAAASALPWVVAVVGAAVVATLSLSGPTGSGSTVPVRRTAPSSEVASLRVPASEEAPRSVVESEPRRTDAEPARTPHEAAPASAAASWIVQAVDADLRPVAGAVIEIAGRDAVAGSGIPLGPSVQEVVTDTDGRGVVTGALEGLRAAVRGGRWATVMEGVLTEDARTAQRVVTVVVARPMRIEGSVVDMHGRPVAGADLVLLPNSTLATLAPESLRDSGHVWWRTETNALGEFELDAIEDGLAQLHVSARGYATATVERLAERLDIVMEDAQALVTTGRIVDGAGVPVVRALVPLAEPPVSGEDGGFAITLSNRIVGGWRGAFLRARFGSRREVWASRAGLLADHVIVDLDAPPPFITLTLAGPALSVRGRVVTPGGEAARNVEVWIEDETYFRGTGNYVSVEQASRGETQWSVSTTDEQGAFDIGGLRDREYTVVALDARTGASARVRVLAGASALAITLPEAPPPRVVEGTVADERGAPVASALVQASHHRQHLVDADGRVVVTRREMGPVLVTDDEGRFRLPLTRAGHVHLSAPGIPSEAEVAAFADLSDVTLSLRRSVECRLTPRATDSLLYVEAYDAGGVRLRAFRKSFETLASLPRLLIQANGKPFFLPDDAAELVLYFADGTTVRRPVALTGLDTYVIDV